MALTAIVGGVAVAAGLGRFEARIVDQAVERSIDDVEEFTSLDLVAIEATELPIVESVAIVDGTTGELVEVPPDEYLEMMAEPEAGITVFGGIQFVMADLVRLGLADRVFAEFADSDGELNVLVLEGFVGAFDRSGALLDVSEPDEVDDIVVPEWQLEQLVAASFERLGGMAQIQDAVRDDGDRDVRFTVVEVDSREIGLIVDVTDELLALDEIGTALWLAAGALTVLAGLATWFLTGLALRPVAAITGRVDEITTGTLDGRVPEPGTGDEIGVLAVTMNRMLGRLERSELQRRGFVSDASHELRTPVAVLRSEAEVATRAPDTTTVGGFAEVVLVETGRLERLVEDLLTLARADESRLADTAGRLGLHGATEVDVDEVVLAEAGRARRLPIDLRQVSGGRVRGRGDDLARAVGHLLDNAARHGESAVAVGVRTEGDRVRIWVEDDGAGLAEEDRVRIFERFTRLDEARSRDRGGSGLGLAVVAETAESFGGTVTVDRGALGGARFTLDLPAGFSRSSEDPR